MKTFLPYFIFLLVMACSNAGGSKNALSDDFRFKILDYGQRIETSGKTSYFFEISIKDKINLRKGDKFEILAEGNRRYTFDFERISGKSGSTERQIVYANTKDDFSEMMELTGLNPILTSPGLSFMENRAPKNENNKNITCSANLDGINWEGSIEGLNRALFYSKGLADMSTADKPYLIVGWNATIGPDNRQLLITSKGFNGKPGILPELEVSFTGSATGKSTDVQIQRNSIKSAKQNEPTNFVFEVTRWEKVGTDKIIMDGKFSGLLKGKLLSSDVQFDKGEVKNIEITVFNEKH